MRRTLLVYMLAGLFSVPAAADGGSKGGASTAKVLSAYRKTASTVLVDEARNAEKVRVIKDGASWLRGSRHLPEVAGSASENALTEKTRDEVVSEETAEAQAKQKKDQKRSDKTFGSRMRMKLLGSTKQIEMTAIEPTEVEKGTSRRMGKVREELEQLSALGEALRKVPGGEVVAGHLETLYGNPLLRDPGKLAKHLDDATAHLEKWSPRQRLARLGAALQARYTKQLKDERPEFDKLLKEGSNEALLEEFDKLTMKELPKFSEHEDVQAQQTLEAAGESHSSSSSQFSASKRGFFSSASASGGSHHESSSSWHAEGASLLRGATQYTVHVKQPGSGGEGVLPFEARLILEKAVRASELAHELSGVAARRGVGAVRPWLNSSVRFEMHDRDLREADESDMMELQRVGVDKWVDQRLASVIATGRSKLTGGQVWNYQDALKSFSGGAITPTRVEAFARVVREWHSANTNGFNDSYSTVVVQLAAPKAGVVELSKIGLVDEERAKMFKDEAGQHLVSDLK
jgi:hypothetical protein